MHAAPSSIIYEEEDEDEDGEEEVEEEVTVGGGDSDKSSNLFHTRKPPSSALAEELVYANSGHHDSEDNLDTLLNSLDQKRITFLVNVWINHIPSQSIRCVEDLFSKFKMPVRIGSTPQFYLTSPPTLSVTDILTKRIHMLTAKDIQRKVQLCFVNNDIRYKAVLPLPSREKCLEYLGKDDELIAFLFDDRKMVARAGGKVGLVGAAAGTSSSSSDSAAPVSSGNVSGGMCIEIDYSSDQDSSDEESGEEGEDEEEEEEDEEVSLPLSPAPSKPSSAGSVAIPVGRNVSNTSLEASRRKKTKLT
ncbi:hypothetical protein EON65_05120 [archaeon]|nr:MAG: hypothetical protein EON65_05120 [archaeon]